MHTTGPVFVLTFLSGELEENAVSCSHPTSESTARLEMAQFVYHPMLSSVKVALEPAAFPETVGCGEGSCKNDHLLVSI